MRMNIVFLAWKEQCNEMLCQWRICNAALDSQTCSISRRFYSETLGSLAQICSSEHTTEISCCFQKRNEVNAEYFWKIQLRNLQKPEQSQTGWNASTANVSNLINLSAGRYKREGKKHCCENGPSFVLRKKIQ